MNKRAGCFFCLLIFCNGFGLATTRAQPQQRPNILVLIADDWAWPHASIAGEPELKTPVFDRVAREGLLFTNAFASAPSCTASRAALLTGQYHWRLEQGASLHQFLPAKFQVYPDILEQSQYQVGFSGKGWGPGDETMGGRIRNPAGNRFADFDDFLSKRTNQKPFCFWYGSPDPHRPYADGSGIRTGKDPKAVRLPQEYPDDPLIRSDMLDYYTEIERFDQSVGEILKKLEKSGELDQTLVVITSDNGRPFPRGKATLYDAGTHVPLAIRWPGGIKSPGRVIDDFVSLTDLAPTFLDLLDLKGLPGRTGRSLGRIFGSSKSGWIDPDRSFTLTGMERHTACRELEKGNFGGGYPMRAIRTKEHLLIHNFKPERWPMGDWRQLADGVKPAVRFDQLSGNTFVAFGDCDASPSKAWMSLHRDEARVKPLFDLAFGKRPEFELYDLQKDPAQIHNVAEVSKYGRIKEDLKIFLSNRLRESKDPRELGGGELFDRYEYLGNMIGAATKKVVSKAGAKRQPAK
ncbi:MAG: sulfatase [Planctomycetota bacterium]